MALTFRSFRAWKTFQCNDFKIN